jgi:hypothetical protein
MQNDSIENGASRHVARNATFLWSAMQLQRANFATEAFTILQDRVIIIILVFLS